MATDVEAIWTALLQRLRSETSGFVTFTRDPEIQYGIESYPVCEVVDGDEEPSLDEDGLPPRLRLAGTIGIVVRSQGGDTAPARLNALVRSVREALERNADDAPEWNRHWTDLGIPGLVLTLGRVQKMTMRKVAGEAWAKIEVEMQTL